MSKTGNPHTLAAISLALGLLGAGSATAQLTSTYPWPVTPFDGSQRITGTFGEYRGPDNPHFHNGTDIPKSDGSPVYSVANGNVTTISPNGSNAYVRVGRYAYVHIRPSPTLSVGDPVTAGVTVLGTIIPGQGHVHFIDGYPGERLNAIRPEGGLRPFVDTWAPAISNVRLYLAATRQRLATQELTGGVEITFRVEEKTAPPGTSGAGLNNGAYRVGYRILSADRTTDVFAPSADGVVYTFDSIPGDSYVHYVFDPIQASTSSHVYIVTNELTSTSSWDTSQLPDGEYAVVLFAEDTRGNRAEEFIDVSISQRDLLPPPQPTLALVRRGTQGLEYAWSGGSAPDLAGFRMHVSTGGSTWAVLSGESDLAPGATAYEESGLPTQPTWYFMTAVDAADPPNESDASDTYGFSEVAGGRVLVVDGFDRTSGSWQTPRHTFAQRHEESLAAAGIGFATAANESVASGRIDLQAYDAVVWILGDESTADETFSFQEQSRVRAYLESGGCLFVTGSEIAWDLGNRGNSVDQAFLRDYLKVSYVGDDAATLNVRGVAGSLFDGLTGFSFGASPYQEDYPDYVDPVGGAEAVILYGNGRIAAVQYEGPFGASSIPGKLVLAGFPFETIGGQPMRDAVMERVMSFFFADAVAVETDVPRGFRVEPPYPNPATETATISYALAAAGRVEVTVTDILGRRLHHDAGALKPAGRHQLVLDADRLASGVYFVKLRSGDESRTVRLVVSR